MFPIFVIIALGVILITTQRSNAMPYLPLVIPSDWSRWVWPVPVTDKRVPHITDGFSSKKTNDHRQHLGVDIMFPKREGDPIGEVLHDASKGSIAPPGTLIMSAGPGKVWSSGIDSYGHWIKIDHGKVGTNGVTTRYAHLNRFSRSWKRGDDVLPGTILGEMGYAPSKDSEQLRHLHFELAFPRKDVPESDWVADPAPFMRHWRKVGLVEAIV